MVEVVGVSIGIFCGMLLLVLLIVLFKARQRFNEIDQQYGKPYKVKLIKMIGGHPELKVGAMAISFHPKDAIAFNRKVFLLSQISSIKVISKLPDKMKTPGKNTADAKGEGQYLCLEVIDEYGRNEVFLTAKADCKELASDLVRKWNQYYLS